MQRKHRLRDRQDFRRVFKHGQSTANRHFVVYVMHKSKGEPVRVGVSVSKKVANRAVDRNRIKRLIKEVVRRWIPRFPAGQDIVIIARRTSVNMTYTQTEQSLWHLFNKAHLLNRESRSNRFK